MPATVDRERIRSVLRVDPVWTVYALGDLDPEQFARCEWHVSQDGAAILLLYRLLETPVLLLAGDERQFGSLLDESGPPDEVYLHVRPSALLSIRERYEVVETRPLLRMGLREPKLAASLPAIPLTRANAAAIEELYRDGEPANEAPDFFFPSMLDDGTFFGIRESGSLVSVAGTHLLSKAESVAAIGNVYTRRDRRGRGLGAAVTTAVVRKLLDERISTIALSVIAANLQAIRVYERLGFTAHCDFVDGIARTPRGRMIS
jgi:ribosomal protein S18 acetylase RimI-like enzyme